MMPAAVLYFIIAFKVGLVLQEIFTECIVIELLIKVVDRVIDEVCMEE